VQAVPDLDLVAGGLARLYTFVFISPDARCVRCLQEGLLCRNAMLIGLLIDFQQVDLFQVVDDFDRKA